MTGEPLAFGDAALGDAKAFMRVESVDEDALVVGLLGSAGELCEQFIRRALLARTFSETLEPGSAWRRLGTNPVTAITAVEAVAEDGSASSLPLDAYALDIDAAGDGWVRVTGAGSGGAIIRATYRAGLAPDWTGLPEALRQGVVRLTAHFFLHRDDPDGGPPAAVTALWRPWRRMRLK